MYPQVVMNMCSRWQTEVMDSFGCGTELIRCLVLQGEILECDINFLPLLIKTCNCPEAQNRFLCDFFAYAQEVA